MVRASTDGHETPDLAYQVTVYYPDGTEEGHRFDCATLYIGRDPQNDLRLQYPRVAARHLMVQVARRDFLVTDLGTAGESRLHGEELEPHMPYKVREGELFQMGPLRLCLELIIEAEVSDQETPGPRPVAPLTELGDGEEFLPPRDFVVGETLRSELDEKLESEPRRVRGAPSGFGRREFRAFRGSAHEQPPMPVDVPWPRILQTLGLLIGLSSLLILVVLALL